MNNRFSVLLWMMGDALKGALLAALWSSSVSQLMMDHNRVLFLLD